jgi:hypothetical protein
VTSSTGFIKITVVFVSLSESTSKDMINDVSCILLDRCGRRRGKISINPFYTTRL